jgi:excinuclease UvrABC nuclease subunit
MENELNPFKVYFNPDFIKKVPQKAGVYFFHSSTGGLLYVGKAVNLRNRLRSYFQLKSNVGESKKVWRMLRLTKNITWEMCSTEEMAVLRENNYIRDLKPPFNVLNKNPHKYFVIFLKNPSLDNLSIELKTWGAFSNKILNKELGMGFGVFRSRRFTREAFFSLEASLAEKG